MTVPTCRSTGSSSPWATGASTASHRPGWTMTGKVLPDEPRPGWVRSYSIRPGPCKALLRAARQPDAESCLLSGSLWISSSQSPCCVLRPPPATPPATLAGSSWQWMLGPLCPPRSLWSQRCPLFGPHFLPYLWLGCHWALGHHSGFNLTFPNNSHANASKLPFQQHTGGGKKKEKKGQMEMRRMPRQEQRRSGARGEQSNYTR